MTKKNNQKLTILSRIVASLLGVLSITAFTMLIMLNVLPIKYLKPIIYIYIPVFIALFILLWLKKVKKAIKITINVIAVILIGIFSFSIFYMYKTMNFMDKISAKEYQLEEYYVMTLKNSGYEELKDIDGKSIGVIPDDTKVYDQAILELNKLVTTEKSKYKDFIEVSQALLDKKVQAIFIGSGQLSLLTDFNEEFSSKTIKIKIISVKVSNNVEVKDVDVSKAAFNIYISGNDESGSIVLKGRSDVNIVMTVNPKTNQILLTDIPRDYYVQLHGTTGLKDKLTHAGNGGIDMSIKTIEDLLDIDINYYVKFNFSSFRKLIDTIGGIDIYSEKSFTSFPDYIRIPKGTTHMNGTMALAFARERHAYLEGDVQRGRNQQQVIKVVIDKLTSSKTLITKYSSILDSLGNSFEINMEPSRIYELVNYQLDNMPSWNFENISLLGTFADKYTRSYPKSLKSVVVPDEKSVTAAITKIDEIEQAK